MKIVLAAAAALAALVSAPAFAVPAPVAAPLVAAPAPVAAPQDRVVVRERTTVTRRNYNRPRYRTRNVCRTTVRYGERRRVCRQVRYRR